MSKYIGQHISSKKSECPGAYHLGGFKITKLRKANFLKL
jgi:hypothetical protein